MNHLIIVGMGQGLSLGVAEKFGAEGFQIGMISRNEEKLRGFQDYLQGKGIISAYATADVYQTPSMLGAISNLRDQLGPVSALLYNAVDYRMKFLLDESVDDLVNGFRISVANALEASRAVLADLKGSQGAILLTGGGSANYPNPDMASISLGKAGLRNLAQQLHKVLREEGVYVGTLTVSGGISPDSPTHSPAILAQKFWELYTGRDRVELVH